MDTSKTFADSDVYVEELTTNGRLLIPEPYRIRLEIALGDKVEAQLCVLSSGKTLTDTFIVISNHRIQLKKEALNSLGLSIDPLTPRQFVRVTLKKVG